MCIGRVGGFAGYGLLLYSISAHDHHNHHYNYDHKYYYNDHKYYNHYGSG